MIWLFAVAIMFAFIPHKLLGCGIEYLKQQIKKPFARSKKNFYEIFFCATV